jgi:hypothetical protein
MHRRQDTEQVNPQGPEKKKPDQLIQNTQAPQPSDQERQGGDKTTPIPSDSAYAPAAEPKKETTVSRETPPEPRFAPTGAGSLADQSSDIAIPSLKGLGSLRQKAEVKHEEEKKKIPVLSLPPLLDFWKNYIESQSSPSLKQTMLEAILEIKGDNIICIRTGHQTGKNRMTAESNLLDGLRSLVRIPELQIVIDIDPDLDKSRDLIKPKKLLSNREKFELLSAKNPLINQLRDKLDLIPDQED